MTKNIRKLVQNYWEDPNTISIIDKNLHKIEIDIASKYLMPSDAVADIGCGDGQATVEYAKKVKHITAIERSDFLLKKAKAVAEEDKLANIKFKKADILTMDLKEQFDVVITQRLLINLLSWPEQQKGLLNIYRALKPGGRYIMIENTTDSFNALNEMRTEVDLSPIPQHWHNRFFDFEKLEKFLEGKFQILKVWDLGLYYFLTRVYSQMFASFKGYGIKAVKDSLFEKSDEAARICFEKFHDRIKFIGTRTLGPIQVFILRRED